MTTIEWNDSEPAFPDFLPPLPPKRELTRAEAIDRLDGVLKANGITLGLDSCGCCEGVEAEIAFPDGTFAKVPHFSVDLGGELTRR